MDEDARVRVVVVVVMMVFVIFFLPSTETEEVVADDEEEDEEETGNPGRLNSIGSCCCWSSEWSLGMTRDFEEAELAVEEVDWDCTRVVAMSMG